MAISSPQPAVLHLFTIFRMIGAGELRIPAFQREFVWKERQVIDLLNSVREHFPIGSMLLWYVDRKMLELASQDVTAFPDVSERYPTSYVLDGMQRLSTLYGTFHYQEGHDPIFNVHYDLREQKFFHDRDGDLFTGEASIPLASILLPRKLLEHQARLASLPDGDALLDELLATQSAFQDYMIPVVRIQSTDVDRIVGIFERTNSTGTRLDTVDFMRAITWNAQFDLNRYLDIARSPLPSEFDLYDETIIKCVGLMLNVAPSAEGLLSLRDRTPQELQDAFNEFPNLFGRVISYLEDRFKIQDLSYVPYEGQLLVLFKAVGLGEATGEPELSLLERWFWAVGFNESLRGKPDHYVVRAVENWRGLVRGQIRSLEPRLRLSEADFLERRLIRGKALSAAFAAMFAVNGARSLLTGEQIPPALYMGASDLNSFVTVVGADKLRSVGIEGPSPRLFPNVVISSPLEELVPGPADWAQLILSMAEAGRYDVLASQFIDEEGCATLANGDLLSFMSRRASLLRANAKKLTTGASELQSAVDG